MFDSFAIPGTVAHQAPLSMDFPGRNTGVAISFSRASAWPGIEPISCIAGRFFFFFLTVEPPGNLSKTELGCGKYYLKLISRTPSCHNVRVPYSCCFSIAKSRPALCNPMDCSTPGFPVLHCLRSLLKLMSIESVMLSNHLTLCCSLLLLPSIFPSIRVFSSKLAICIRGPKYQNSVSHIYIFFRLYSVMSYYKSGF